MLVRNTDTLFYLKFSYTKHNFLILKQDLGAFKNMRGAI